MVNITNRENTVWLCKAPLENDYVHQLTFSTREEQTNYFQSISEKILYNLSFIREPINGIPKNYITVPMEFGRAQGYNYIMYLNKGNNNGYGFAFITKYEFISNNATRLYLETDAFQNWQFRINYHPSFIERQTPNTFKFRNSLSDDVDTGQLVEITTRKVINFGAFITFCSTDITQDVTYDSAPYSLKIGDYVIPCWCLYWEKTESEEMGRTIQSIIRQGWGDRIIGTVYVPFIGNRDYLKFEPMQSERIGKFKLVTEINPKALFSEFELTDVPAYDYGKEMTYPYAKIVIEDLSTGQTMEYAPEKFTDGFKFEFRASISESPSYSIIPVNYCGQIYAYDQALNVRCNTLLPNINNQYANYLLQNTESNNISMLSALGSAGLTLATKNPTMVASGALNLFTSISNIVAQENKASKLNNVVTNIVDGAQQRLLHENGFKISLFSMDADHKIMCRNYWKMFGYPVKTLAMPNINTGGKYNYIKAIDMNIDCPAPQDEIKKIKNMFENGVTLWHYPNPVGVY